MVYERLTRVGHAAFGHAGGVGGGEVGHVHAEDVGVVVVDRVQDLLDVVGLQPLVVVRYVLRKGHKKGVKIGQN